MNTAYFVYTKVAYTKMEVHEFFKKKSPLAKSLGNTAYIASYLGAP